MIVAMRPATRFIPPMTEGTIPRIPSGNDVCAKFAVPVTVDKTMTGRVNRIDNVLYIK
jgi:hypothetical protein